MNNDNLKLDEQEAPEKNGDKAFVQVGTDGKPVMPDPKTSGKDKDSAPKEGTLADR